MSTFTIIKSLEPARVGKTYSVDAKGEIVKKPLASIWKGRATTLEATTKNLVAALRRTTESENEVIVLSSFIGAAPGSPAEIEVVTADKLESLRGLKKGEIGAPAAGEPGYFTVEGKIVSARLKRLMAPSGWVLLDADSPPELPDEWKRLSLAERLALLDRPGLLPGISTCERIEYRGSSARVVNGSGAQNPGPTHALIRISDPSKLDLMREHVRVQAVIEGLSFDSSRYSKLKPGTIVGVERRTLTDLAVLVDARLIFNARPDVSKAPGYRVLDANVRIVNPNGGALDVDWIKPPDAPALKEYRAETGVDVRISKEGGGFAVHERGTLTLDTEIESRGVVAPLADWLVKMLDGDLDKLRCEAPFRASASEAAFVRIAASGEVFVHDSGTTTSSYLDRLPQTEEEAAARAASFEEYEALMAILAARTRQVQRHARSCFPAPTNEQIEAAEALTRRSQGASLDEVKKAAEALAAGDIDGARAVFDELAEVKNRTPATDDIVVDIVSKALGKAVKVKSVRTLLRDADTRFADTRAAGPFDLAEGGPPREFRESNGWMRYRMRTDDGFEWVPICSPLSVAAMLRDGASSCWGLLVNFKDADEREHDVPVPAEVCGDPNALAPLLLREGLKLADASLKTRAALSSLLLKWSHPDRRTIAPTPGWTHDRKAFLLADGRVIGDQTVVLGHGRVEAARLQTRGDLSAWKALVASLCADNPVLLTGVSAAFAAPLLDVLNVGSGAIVHLRGDSSRGKTTVLCAAFSAWGLATPPLPTWRATANGLEGVAAAHNSTLLVLDELHQVSPREAGPAALMICNGAGKTRANQRGETRAAKTWKLLALSSGECSLTDRIAAAATGEDMTAGQEVRFLDLKADERAFGCFDALHGETDGRAFSARLASACAQAYGTAGPAFVEFVMHTPDIERQARGVVAQFEADAETTYKLAGADAQVTRALRQFAVIAAGGELATEAEITGWTAGEASAALLEMFGVWVGARGGLMSALDRNAVTRTRAFLIKNGSRFQDLVPDGAGGLILSSRILDRPIHNLAGWRDPDGYWVAADVWTEEIHAGVDAKAAARVLRDAGLLTPDRNQGSRLTRRGPRVIDRVRCYYVKKDVLATEQGT